MESTETTLELGSDVLATPTMDDLARAIARRPRGEDWAITLNHGEDDFMLAMLDGDGGVEVEAEEGGQSYYTEDAVDDARLQALFASFLARDGAWRQEMKLSAPPPPGGSREMNRVAAPIWVTLSLVAIGLAAGTTGHTTIAAVVGAIFIPAFFAAAAYEKWREVKRASTWKAAAGRIVRSELVTETRKGDDGKAREVKLPAVEYEFSVSLKPYRGSRITIGEILPGTPAVEEALKKYPVGASATVHYDPADPRQSVLERDPPAPFPVIFGVLGAIAVAAVAAALYFTGTFG